MARTDPSLEQVVAADGTVWRRPGKGTWQSGADHVPHAVTASYEELYPAARGEGMADFFERYGMPVAGFDCGFVNGRMYDKLVPLVGAESDAPPPPAPILWLFTRLHPQFRARAKRMAETFAPVRRWRAEADAWISHERQQWLDRNLALTDEDPAALDVAGVGDHLRRVVAHYHVAVARHFSIKGVDSAPLGDLLALTNELGVPTGDVLALLRGCSPASGVPAALQEVAAVVRASGTRPASLDEVRALGADASSALDAYLREFGARIVTGYDIGGRTLAELPDTIVRSIVAVADRPPVPPLVPGRDALDGLLSRVPAPQRAEVEARFEEAVIAYGIRDDNGPLTFQWPVGLLRRAMLAAGARLTELGLLDAAEEAVDLRTDEVLALLDGRPGPSAADARERAATRRRNDALTPPEVLGPPPVDLPVHVMPAPLARGVRAIEAFLASMTGVRADRRRLEGVGIGTETYRGRAVIAPTPEEAFAKLEPGDVLIARCTTPAYNSILPIVGAIVTEEGGGLSHAAIVARELGIAAVVGVLDATTALDDGAWVEVDPVGGTVRAVPDHELADTGSAV